MPKNLDLPDREKHPYRYPGVQPFTTGQAHVFFGREQDAEELLRLVRREALVVLYGKSGLGKSSLLNAGIVPKYVTGGGNAINIRFGAWVEGAVESPLSITKKAVSEGFDQLTFLDKLLPDDQTLWFHAKARQLNGGGHPLLIFDQFEELFSYPDEQVQVFKEELAELMHTDIPLRFRRMAEVKDNLTDAEEDQLEEPLDTRHLFAIRSDRMQLLHKLADRLPTIFGQMYELKALRPDDAVRAIKLPAESEGNFRTPQFSWEKSAVGAMLQFLQNPEDENRVEGILLQLLCQYFEEKLVEKSGLTKLENTDLGDLEAIVEQYYFEKIASLGDEATQLAARRLIEEGLVLEGENIRLSLHEAQIGRQYRVGTDLLNKLVDSRLLRAEPYLRGGYSYELAHDRMVPPVLAAKQERRRVEAEAERLEKERQLEEAKMRAAEERALREKAEEGQKQARRGRKVAALISVFAVGFAIIAGWSFLQSKEAQKLAEQERDRATVALENFQKEQAAKELLKFNTLENRANTILDAGGCPLDIFAEMSEIMSTHPDSINLKNKLNLLFEKNPDCK